MFSYVFLQIFANFRLQRVNCDHFTGLKKLNLTFLKIFIAVYLTSNTWESFVKIHSVVKRSLQMGKLRYKKGN